MDRVRFVCAWANATFLQIIPMLLEQVTALGQVGDTWPYSGALRAMRQ